MFPMTQNPVETPIAALPAVSGATHQIALIDRITAAEVDGVDRAARRKTTKSGQFVPSSALIGEAEGSLHNRPRYREQQTRDHQSPNHEHDRAGMRALVW